MTAGEYLAMVQDRRIENLRRLVDCAGSQTAAAEMIGMEKHQLCNTLAGRRPMTEYRARRIEQNAGLGFGSLDLMPSVKEIIHDRE